MTNKQAAIKVIKQLHNHGYQALFAGGCVRDMLIGRRANDYDVATDARPKEVIGLFKRTIKVGVQFGVVIVLIEDQQVQVATFRSDCDYTDGRHPANVKFVTAAEDARRRDFTINGMFYDPTQKELIDYVNGQADLKSGVIRTIGEPHERFSEDYLRMLRAVRFSTQLGFRICPATWSAVCGTAENITKISGERIAMELEGILVDPRRSAGAVMLIKTGLAEAIFPGFTGQKAKSAIEVLSALRKNVSLPLALAAFFVNYPEKFTLEKCVILMLSRNQNKHIKFLLANRGKLLNEKMSLAELKNIAAEPYFWDLYELQRAIQKAGKKSITELVNLRKRLKALGDIQLKPKPLLTGHDLIRLGAAPGPALGQLAEDMYIVQLEGKLQNAEQAQNWAKKWLQKHKAIKDG